MEIIVPYLVHNVATIFTLVPNLQVGNLRIGSSGFRTDLKNEVTS